MIGIDIVDHSDPLLRKRNNAYRFVSHPLDHMLEADFWKFWTAKESVFKASREKSRFDPKSIAIKEVSQNRFVSEGFQGSIVKTHEYTLAISSKRHYYHVLFECKTPDPSSEVRVKVASWFRKRQGIITEIIEDNNGLPLLSHSKKQCSISHHGNYLAFAFLVE